MKRAIFILNLVLVVAGAQAQSAIEAWAQRYNGPGNGGDSAEAIVVSTSGNVFVTGSSGDTTGYSDYATIAYSGAGVPLWTRRYNGPANNSDGARGIALDGDGNVYVTGYSEGIGSSADYCTIKYSGTGVPLWTNRYNGPGNGADYATAIVIDVSGDVFVCGYSYRGGSGYDYAIVKYSSAGVSMWTNRYNGSGNGADYAYAIAGDSNGNVFVNGFSFGNGSSYDYAIVAYSGAGVPLWTNRYNGPGNNEDRSHAITVDGAGSVIVTGHSARDSISPYNYDYATIKYSNTGVPLWTNRFSGPGNNPDQANAIAVDGSGNVFVTGFAVRTNASINYATIKYSNTGLPLWTNWYIGPKNIDDRANAIAVDANGNVIVTGQSYGNDNNYDYATIAYSAAGVPMWTNRYKWLLNGGEEARGVAIVGSANVYVTGRSTGSSDFYDYATVKYSLNLSPIPISIQKLDGQLTLTWTQAAFGLQTAPTAMGPFTNVNGATSPYTNSIDSEQQFFRLISN